LSPQEFHHKQDTADDHPLSGVEKKDSEKSDLGKYITQINTDIGKSFNKELFLNKISKVSLKLNFGFGKVKGE